MSQQIKDSLIKINRDRYDDTFNLTSFFQDEVDIFYFRIVDQVNNYGTKFKREIKVDHEGVEVIKGSHKHKYPKKFTFQWNEIGPQNNETQIEIYDEIESAGTGFLASDKPEFLSIL